MASVTIEEAQAKLADLIHRLQPGEELEIIENGQTVAKLSAGERLAKWPCKAGSASGKIRMAPDFDEPLEDFREYME